MASKITLRWVEKSLFVSTDSHGHSIVVGQDPDAPDQWIGVKPSDLLLMSVAACASWDVVEILRKQRQPLEDLTVQCLGEQLPEPPHTFTAIQIKYCVTGPVNPEKLGKAIQLSEQKYCSVINTLRPGVSIRSEYEIIATKSSH